MNGQVQVQVGRGTWLLQSPDSRSKFAPTECKHLNGGKFSLFALNWYHLPRLAKSCSSVPAAANLLKYEFSVPKRFHNHWWNLVGWHSSQYTVLLQKLSFNAILHIIPCFYPFLCWYVSKFKSCAVCWESSIYLALLHCHLSTSLQPSSLPPICLARQRKFLQFKIISQTSFWEKR